MSSSPLQFLLENTFQLNNPATSPTKIAGISLQISQYINSLSFGALIGLFRDINAFSMQNAGNAPEMRETVLRLKVILWQRIVSMDALEQNDMNVIMENVQKDWELHHDSAWFVKKVGSLFSIVILKVSRAQQQFLGMALKELLRLATQDSAKALCVLFTLQSVAETVFSTESRYIHWTLGERLHLRAHFLNEASTIFQFVYVVLTQTQDEDAIRTAIETLSCFVSGIPDAVLLNDNMVKVLSQFMSKRKYRNEILSLFSEWIGKSPSTQQAFQVFSSVLTNMAPQVDSLMQMGFVDLLDRDQKLALTYFSFLSLYFQKHMDFIVGTFATVDNVRNVFGQARIYIIRMTQWAHKFDDQITRALLPYLRTVLHHAEDSTQLKAFIDETSGADYRNLLLQITPLHPSCGIKFDTETNRLQKTFSSKLEYDSFVHMLNLLTKINPAAMSTFCSSTIQKIAQHLAAQPSINELNALQSVCNMIGSCPPLDNAQISQCFAVIKGLFNNHAPSHDLKLWYGACFLHMTRQSDFWMHAPSDVIVDTIGLCQHFLQQKDDSLLHTMCCENMLFIFEHTLPESMDDKKTSCVLQMFQSSDKTIASLSMEVTFAYFKCLGRALQLLSPQLQRQCLSAIMRGPHQTLQNVLSQATDNMAIIVEPDNIRALEYTLKAYSKTSSKCGATIWAREYEGLHQNLEALYNVTRSWTEGMWKQHGEQVIKIATVRRALRIKALIIQILEHAVEAAQSSTIAALLERVTSDFLESPASLKPYRLLNLLSVVMRRQDLLNHFVQIFCAVIPTTANIVAEHDGEYNALNLSALTLIGVLIEKRDVMIAVLQRDNTLRELISILLESMDKPSSKVYTKAHKIMFQLMEFAGTSSQEFFSSFFSQYNDRVLGTIVRLLNQGDHKEAFLEQIELLFRLLHTAAQMKSPSRAGGILVKEFREWNDALTDQILQDAITRGMQSVVVLRDEMRKLLLLGEQWDSTDFER